MLIDEYIISIPFRKNPCSVFRLKQVKLCLEINFFIIYAVSTQKCFSNKVLKKLVRSFRSQFGPSLHLPTHKQRKLFFRLFRSSKSPGQAALVFVLLSFFSCFVSTDRFCAFILHMK